MRYDRMPFGYLMTLDPGEELLASLIRITRHLEIEGGALQGLGAVRDVELGFYHKPERPGGAGHYERHTFAGPLEVCSITGTLSLLDGEPFPHVHGVFSMPDCTTVGGHVFAAVCDVTVEIAVHDAATALHRGPVDHCDLKLLQLEEQP